MSSPQQRLSSIANQVQAPGSAPARQRLLAKHPDDIVSVPLHYTY
jgi:acetyl-CoA acyltransferase 1